MVRKPIVIVQTIGKNSWGNERDSMNIVSAIVFHKIHHLGKRLLIFNKTRHLGKNLINSSLLFTYCFAKNLINSSLPFTYCFANTGGITSALTWDATLGRRTQRASSYAKVVVMTYKHTVDFCRLKVQLILCSASTSVCLHSLTVVFHFLPYSLWILAKNSKSLRMKYRRRDIYILLKKIRGIPGH